MRKTRNASRFEKHTHLTIVAGVILVVGSAFLLLLAGITSTLIGWIPQPTLDTLTTAFAVYLVMMASISLVRIGRVALQLSSLSGVLLVVGVSSVVVVPFLYVLVYSVETLWVELPSTYEAHASFFFVIALLVANIIPSDD